jgi:hypothetical protein
MSCWTHIVATIDVDTFIQDKNIKDITEGVLQYAPKITGSERDARVYVNVLDGHNTSIYVNDGNCESYQTRVVITVIGDLRDRDKETTLREYREFVKFIKDKWMIRNKTVKITN